MKPRTVFVTLELETDEKIKTLRDKTAWRVRPGTTIKQVQVNVAKGTKGAVKR